jgi:predicted RNase H-like HicB family nuclease
MQTYDYIAWQDEGKWTAHSPAAPGVYGVGPTRRAAEQDLHQALLELLAHLRDIGEAPPANKGIIQGTLHF